jgi:hypothetical protein
MPPINTNLFVGVGLELALRLGMVDDGNKQRLSDVAMRHLAAYCHDVGRTAGQRRPFKRPKRPLTGKHARRRAARYIRRARRKRLRMLAKATAL